MLAIFAFSCIALATAAAAVTDSAPAAIGDGAACTTAADCSLNGDCVGGACACDAEWSGSPTCDILSLAPAATGAHGYYNTTSASWGGRPVYDSTTGRWHMFVAQMANGCSLWTWKNNSAVVHTVSSGPDAAGPYAFVEDVVPPFAHNPKLYAVPPSDGGGFVIFAIGGGLWRPIPVTNCSHPWAAEDLAAAPWRHQRRSSMRVAPGGDADPTSPTQDGCGPEPPLNGGCGITASFAPTLAGPWTTTPVLFVNQNASALLNCSHTNPSVVWVADGSGLRMAFNAGYCHDGVETIGIASAPSWRGPWNLANTEPVLTNASGAPHSCEDPTLWQSDRGWHLMVHDQSGGFVARYAHSLNGVTNWTLHNEPTNPGPYNGTVVFADGSVAHTDVERPELVFDPLTGRPSHLVNGAFAGAAGNLSTFTLIRPLKRSA